MLLQRHRKRMPKKFRLVVTVKVPDGVDDVHAVAAVVGAAAGCK